MHLRALIMHFEKRWVKNHYVLFLPSTHTCTKQPVEKGVWKLVFIEASETLFIMYLRIKSLFFILYGMMKTVGGVEIP